MPVHPPDIARRSLLAAAALCLTGAAFAQDQAPPTPTPHPELAAEPDYLDDRSTPEALIRSLYNALEREEYARAYSYFAEDADIGDFNTFSAGYEGTEAVTLILGEVNGEGTAGSVYWQVPVAVRAEHADGSIKVFGGCYTLRLASPAIQGVPFQPMQIIAGNLEPSDQGLNRSLPAGCDG